MWNCSEDEFAFTDAETRMQFGDSDGALRSKHKYFASGQQHQPSPLLVCLLLLLPLLHVLLCAQLLFLTPISVVW